MVRQVGAVAGGHQRTAEAGARMLAEGGNAVDAAVAAAFTAATCEPSLTGPGGAGFAIVHPASGPPVAFDFFAAVPGIGRLVDSPLGPVPVDVLFGDTAQTFYVGPHSCAVPGFVPGVLAMHERFGRLPRSVVLEPAIEIAREGLVITASQAYQHQLLEGIFLRTAYGQRLFAPEGAFLGEGDRFAQGDLAATLEHIAQVGPSSMTTGDLAAEIVQWSKDNDALLTAEDLARYEVRMMTPVEARFRGLRTYSTPPPSSGGSLVAYALSVLDGLGGDVAGSGEDGAPIDLDGAVGAAQVVGAMLASNSVRGAEFDRYLYADGGLVEWLLSPELVADGVAMLERGADVPPPHPTSRLGSTTHCSTIDAEGCAVAMTASTGCGAGEFVGTTGIHLNNMLGEEDLVPVEHTLAPGERLTSMMAPTIVCDERGPLLATGSAGSSRIRSAVVQTLVRAFESRRLQVAADGEPVTQARRLHAAVRAGRMHAENGVVHVEPDVAPDAIAGLEAAGHVLERWPFHNMYFGGVNMVAVDADGVFAAAADPRRGGGESIAWDDGTLARPDLAS